jgi:hypothetical protein
MNTQENDGWIKMSERKPTDADCPVWYWRDGGAPCHYHSLSTLVWTHWKPSVLPAPPPKEQTQEQIDYAEYVCWWEGNADSPKCNTWPAWKAALAYRDAQNREDLGRIRVFNHNTPDELTQTGAAIVNLRKRCGLDK